MTAASCAILLHLRRTSKVSTERSDVACTVLLDLSFPDEAYPSIRGNPLRSFMFRKIIMHSLGAPVPIVIVIYNDEPVLIYGWE